MHLNNFFSGASSSLFSAIIQQYIKFNKKKRMIGDLYNKEINDQELKTY